jgi:hypothetical protein
LPDPKRTKGSLIGPILVQNVRTSGGLPVDDDVRNAKSDDLTDSIDRSVIAVPLQEKMRQHPTEPDMLTGRSPPDRIDVVIDLNYNFSVGVDGARKKVEWIVAYLEFLATHTNSIGEGRPRGPALRTGTKRKASGQFVFATLTPREIRDLVAIDSAKADDASLVEVKKAFGKRLAKKFFDSRAIHRIWPDFEMRGLEGA